MTFVSKEDKETLGEFFLIVGGFIFAETIVRTFLNIAATTPIPFWVLPCLGLLLVIMGGNLKNGIKSDFWLGSLFIIFTVVFSVLVNAKQIGAYTYLWGIGISLVLYTIISLIKKFW